MIYIILILIAAIILTLFAFNLDYIPKNNNKDYINYINKQPKNT